MGNSGSTLRAPFMARDLDIPLPAAIRNYYFQSDLRDLAPLDEWLSGEGKDFDLKLSVRGNTLMHYAAIRGDVPLIQCLARHDPQLVNTGSYPYGFTPLHSAVLDRRVEAVKCLLALGADKQIGQAYGHSTVDDRGHFYYGVNMTALEMAKYHRRTRAIDSELRDYDEIISLLQ